MHKLYKRIENLELSIAPKRELAAELFIFNDGMLSEEDIRRREDALKRNVQFVDVYIGEK